MFYDPNHVMLDNYYYESESEQRYQVIGMSQGLLLLSVVFIERHGEQDETVHLISARKATKYEEVIYRTTKTEDHG